MKILHKVKGGDSLEKIALNYNCSVDEIVKINDLSSYNISHLDLIEIPENKSDFIVIKNENKEFLLEVNNQILPTIKEFLKDKVVIASSNIGASEYEFGDKIIFKKVEGKTYTTKPLDTIKTIAKKFGVTQEQIIKNNNLKTSKLFIGQKIVI